MGAFHGCRQHAAQEPVGLFWDLARAVTRAGDVVADLFVGRGRGVQKLLAEGRHVVAVDRDPGLVEGVKGDFRRVRLPTSSLK